jgi:aspartate kinase
VEGVYTADPRVVPNARKIEEISYDEMLELATLGAKVLHNRSVELAKKYGVQLVVRSSLNTAEGTTVKEVASVESMLVSGVAVDKDAARIAIIGLKNEPGIAFKVFDLLAKHNINVDVILQSIGRDDTKDISFTVDQTQAKEAVQLLKENKERLTIQKIEEDESVAKLSIVGAGMQSNAGVAAKMFEALYGVGVNIRMIATSEIRITVLIDLDDVQIAMKAVHAAFLEE